MEEAMGGDIADTPLIINSWDILSLNEYEVHPPLSFFDVLVSRLESSLNLMNLMLATLGQTHANDQLPPRRRH